MEGVGGVGDAEKKAGRGTGGWPVTAPNQVSLSVLSLCSFFHPLLFCSNFLFLSCSLDLETLLGL